MLPKIWGHLKVCQTLLYPVSAAVQQEHTDTSMKFANNKPFTISQQRTFSPHPPASSS